MITDIASFVNERAMTAASVRQRRGPPDIAVIRGGCTTWTARKTAPPVA